MLESNKQYDWWCSWPVGKDEHLADKTITEDGIDYSYNNLGFRGSAFHGTSGIVGDSYVYGTGVNFPFAILLLVIMYGIKSSNQQVWPYEESSVVVVVFINLLSH